MNLNANSQQNKRAIELMKLKIEVLEIQRKGLVDQIKKVLEFMESTKKEDASKGEVITLAEAQQIFKAIETRLAVVDGTIKKMKVTLEGEASYVVRDDVSLNNSIILDHMYIVEDIGVDNNIKNNFHSCDQSFNMNPEDEYSVPFSGRTHCFGPNSSNEKKNKEADNNGPIFGLADERDKGKKKVSTKWIQRQQEMGIKIPDENVEEYLLRFVEDYFAQNECGPKTKTLIDVCVNTMPGRQHRDYESMVSGFKKRNKGFIRQLEKSRAG